MAGGGIPKERIRSRKRALPAANRSLTHCTWLLTRCNRSLTRRKSDGATRIAAMTRRTRRLAVCTTRRAVCTARRAVCTAGRAVCTAGRAVCTAGRAVCTARCAVCTARRAVCTAGRAVRTRQRRSPRSAGAIHAPRMRCDQLAFGVPLSSGKGRQPPEGGTPNSSRRLRGAGRFCWHPWVSLRFTHGYRSGWRHAPNDDRSQITVHGSRWFHLHRSG